MGKLLKPVQGKLSNKKIAEGINAARSNAQRLHADAKLMGENSRFASCLALSILSIEESSKSSILLRLALAKNSQEIKACWKDFTSHRAKNREWAIVDMVTKGARHLQDFKEMYTDKESPELIENIKHVALYTSCNGKNHWSIPEKVVDENLARHLLEVSGVLITERESSEREIDIWVRHLKPVYGSGREEEANALIAYHEELVAEGIASEGKMPFREFIMGEANR